MQHLKDSSHSDFIIDLIMLKITPRVVQFEFGETKHV